MMNQIDAWNSFWFSGRIYDYLMYKSAHNSLTDNPVPEIKKNNEDNNERPDSKRTEYR